MANLSQFTWAPPNQLVKKINKFTVLDLIRFTPGGISRAELAQRMDLSRAAMTLIVNDLLDSKVIHETELRTKKNGRPPIILEVNSTRGLVMGIDMGASHISIIMTDFGAQVIDEIEVPFSIADGPELCIRQADTLVSNLLKKNNATIQDIYAIGLGVPGPIDSQAGMVYAPPLMPGWDGYPIQQYLQEKWGLPVSLNNDSELGALGEWAYGVGRGENHLAYIKVGSGVGCGLLLNGQIYHGATGSAGEIGHLTIVENGPLCDCGNSGCLETLAGGKAIARQARDAILSGQRTLLTGMGPIELLTARDVTSAARRGDLVSQNIIASAGRYLGIAIAGLVNLFNPQTIVVGGGVAQVGDLLLQPIRDTVTQRSLKASARTVKINTAVLRRHSSGMGAIVQALSIALHQVADERR
ncbi:MAG: ROK family protein [Chloroflexi bacterium]|nr:ROK family protein [Chloroflexota bacterium]